jgi:hypothetical protein
MDFFTIYEIYQKLFMSGTVSGYVTAARVLGGLLVVIELSRKMMISFSSTGKVITESKDWLSPHDFYRSLGILALAVLSPEILKALDYLLSALMIEGVTGMTQSVDNVAAIFEAANNEIPSGANETLGASVLRYFRNLTGMFSLSNILTSGVLNALLFIIESFIYPIFLAERFFFMGLIRLFFPLIIVFSIYEPTRKYALNIVKMYARWWLVIVPFLFVNVFTDILKHGFIDMLVLDQSNAFASAAITMNKNMLNNVVLVFAIIIKIKLYKRSIPFMKELIE